MVSVFQNKLYIVVLESYNNHFLNLLDASYGLNIIMFYFICMRRKQFVTKTFLLEYFMDWLVSAITVKNYLIVHTRGLINALL